MQHETIFHLSFSLIIFHRLRVITSRTQPTNDK
ncbi:MAG: hypothetical protein JWM21_3711 [Acidobacteria bacterium]|nr:hypothetical protein [Acidobacteriota bacterium]